MFPDGVVCLSKRCKPLQVFASWKKKPRRRRRPQRSALLVGGAAPGLAQPLLVDALQARKDARRAVPAHDLDVRVRLVGAARRVLSADLREEVHRIRPVPVMALTSCITISSKLHDIPKLVKRPNSYSSFSAISKKRENVKAQVSPVFQYLCNNLNIFPQVSNRFRTFRQRLADFRASISLFEALPLRGIHSTRPRLLCLKSEEKM